MERSARLATLAATGLVLLLAGLFGLRCVSDADLPWHLAAGQEILETGSVPRVDTWSVLGRGRDWLDIHWLAQLAMVLLWRLGGFVLLQVATAAVAVAALAAALRAGRAAELPALGPALGLLGLLVAQSRLSPRPDLASLVLPCLLLGALDGHARRRPGALGVLGVLQALWTNLHGSFVLGPLMAAAALAADLAPRSERGSRARSLKALLLVLGATLANPRGPLVWRLYRPYLEAVGARLGFGSTSPPLIQEWHPTFSAAARPYLDPVLAPYLALVLLGGLSFVVARDRLSLRRALVLCLFAGLSVSAIRNLAPFALVAVAVIPPHLAAGLPGLAPRARSVAACLLGAATALGSSWIGLEVASNRWFVSRLDRAQVGPGVLPTAYPEGACGWVEAAGIRGQAFHNYEVGGYYLLRFRRERPPFLDGRLDLLAPEEVARYARAMQDPGAFEALVRSHGVTHLILRYAAADAGPLVLWLERGQGGWRRAYLDEAGVVYLRAGEPVPAVEPRRLAPHPWDAAAAELFAPIARRQRHLPTGLLNLGQFHHLAGEMKEAARAYEKALAREPGLAPARLRLAYLYRDLGERDAALRELGWLSEHAPGEPGLAELRTSLKGR